MKIAVNTRFLLAGKLEGFGKFTYETLKRITQQHPEHTFYFFFDGPYDKQFIFANNVVPVVLKPPARHPLLMMLWNHVLVKRALKKTGADVYLSTDGQSCLTTSVPCVTVIHDLAFEHRPLDLGLVTRQYLQYYTPRFAKASERVVAVSDYTRQDLVRTYSLDSAKIDVVYNDASEFFRPLPEAAMQPVRDKFSLGKPYFMFVGALHPRKNLVNLFGAFDAFKKQTSSDVKLLIVGRKAWNAKAIGVTFQNMAFQSDVIFTGRVSDEDLNNLYGAALASVYVPFFEGFGIPIVESQKCHCPVITSNVTSMPEVAGNGALLVNPEQVTEIASAMVQLYQQPDLRQELISKGIENVKRFSWQQSAEKLLASVLKAAKK